MSPAPIRQTAADAATLGVVLRHALGSIGVGALYGEPLPGLGVVAVDDTEVAALMAAAHRRVHGGGAGVHFGGNRIALGSESAPAFVVRGEADLARLAPGVSFEIDADLAAPAVAACVPVEAGPRWVPFEADALAQAEAPVALVGPGVIADRVVADLHALAASANLGVLNTWGAKGVFDWRSRHHLATVGLQALDFELGGVAGADTVVTIGLDPQEVERRWWALAPVVDVPTAAVGPLAEAWSRPRGDLAVPPLRARLAAVTQDGWARTAAPLPPSRVTMHYAATVDLVAADAGLAGYWVARTFGTTEPGRVIVPAQRQPGFAAACALVARLRQPGRPVLAVVDATDAEIVDRVLASAAALGVALPVEVWDAGGPALDADAHVDRLRAIVAHPRPAPAPLATDQGQLRAMVEAAGEVVAWGGLA